MAAGKKAGADRQIAVGGRSLTLRYSLKAMIALQDHYGLDSLDAVGRRLADGTMLGGRDLAAVLWAGLRTHHPEITMDEAVDILDGAGMADMQKLMGEAFEAASDDAGAEDAGEARPPGPGRSTG